MIPNQDEAALEFKTWFGKSQIVNADGNPLVVYHGTMSSTPIVEFHTRAKLDDEANACDAGTLTLDPNVYLGAHFAIGESAHQVADKFALGENSLVDESHDFLKKRADCLGKAAAPTVYPAYLKIENLKVFGSETDLVSFFNECNLDELSDLYRTHRPDVFDQEFGNERDEAIICVGPYINLARAIGENSRRRLIDAGYDGVLYRNDNEGGWAVAPIKDLKEQIRFAIPNAHAVRKLISLKKEFFVPYSKSHDGSTQ